MSRHYVSAATTKTITKTLFIAHKKNYRSFLNIFLLCFISDIIRLDMQWWRWWWWCWWARCDLPCQLSWHFCKWIMNNSSARQFVALCESAEIVTHTLIDILNCWVISATPPSLPQPFISMILMNGFRVSCKWELSLNAKWMFIL